MKKGLSNRIGKRFLKGIGAVLTVLLVLAAAGMPAYAAGMSGGSGDDTADLIGSMETYFNDYLPGVPEKARQALEGYVESGLKNDKDRFFMPMMSTLASMRKAGQAGEGEGIADVVGGYGKLSDDAKKSVVDNLTAGFQGIGLDVSFSDGVMAFSKDGTALTEIPFSAEQASDAVLSTPAASSSSVQETSSKAESTAQTGAPTQAMADAADGDGPTPDVATTYFHAYLPGVPDEFIAEVKKLISVYSENGGGPEGSGALWRCVREAGELMGRKVEMAPDYTSFTVAGEGETEFLKLSSEAQEKVVEKVKEGMTGIAVTAEYSDGTFSFTKKGETQFAYTVKGAAAPVTETASSAEGSSSEESGETQTADQSGSSVPVYIGLAALLCGVALLIIFRNKIFRSTFKKM